MAQGTMELGAVLHVGDFADEYEAANEKNCFQDKRIYK